MQKKCKIVVILGIVLSIFFILFPRTKEVIQYYTTSKEMNIFFKHEENTYKDENYTMVLEIPKIQLKKGIYSVSSKYNNVNHGIEMLPESTFLNNEKGTLFLASHSGTSSISYFNRLQELEKKDQIIIYYLDKMYIYEIINQYEIEKNGSFLFPKDSNNNQVVLITCDKMDDSFQIIYVGNLIKTNKVLGY